MADSAHFEEYALKIMQLQYEKNKVYHHYLQVLGVRPGEINRLEDIPFLPISFFKTHNIVTGDFEPQKIFESSGTTGANTSRHRVKDLEIYEKSFIDAFDLFYGDVSKYCVLGLLPGYLERQNSSLTYMVQEMIERSSNPKSGFFLYNHKDLLQVLQATEEAGEPVLLIGVTFSLLDFAEKHKLKLHHTIVMETGGMKGRREEWTRQQVHEFLQDRLGVPGIHTEYSMTELLSQAYAKGDGRLHCPPWMKILIREPNDPFAVTASEILENPKSGLINIIDLANIYSCSFIATDDVGKLYPDDSFEVLGRRDSSDLRGCSLLTA